MRVIELDPSETFYSLRDRILNGARGRVVLVVPPRGAALRGAAHLILLRRLADRERLEVGLVTGDRSLARRARALGLPTFTSLTLAEHFRPGWWRSRRGARLGLPPNERRAPATTQTAPGRGRVALVMLAVAVLTMLTLVAAAVFAPRATIHLRPATQQVQAIADLTAEPSRDAADSRRRTVPATEVQLVQSWETTVTGRGESARQMARALAQQGLGAAAPGLLGTRLDPGLRLVPSSVRVEIVEERLDGGTLALEAELSALAVAEMDVVAALGDALAAALPAGFVLDPATTVVAIDPAAGDAPGLFTATAQATGRGYVDATALPGLLAGRRIDEAVAYLSALPLAEPPALDVWPRPWASLGRLPLRAEQLTIAVVP